MDNFIIANYISGGLIPMIISEFIRGIAWTLGAAIVIKLFRVKFN